MRSRNGPELRSVAEENSRAAPSTGPDTKPGSPSIPDGARAGNILLNTYGWNCNAVSNSQAGHRARQG
jgi:hypothetical protein